VIYLQTIRHRQSLSFVSILVASVVLMFAQPTHAEDDKRVGSVVDQMLDALGGRQNWADLRNTINGSQQNRADEPTVVYSVITMDFERPRFRIETTASDIHVIRVIDGDDSWRLRLSGNIEDVPADLYDEEMRWYGAHLYRTIHRIASRDPAISLTLDGQGRLQVFEDGGPIMWFRLDADGQPYRFGTYDDEAGTLLGPWGFEQDGIRHPAWVSNPDGTWRAAVRSLSVNVPLKDHMFKRPE
jgi:hypothetical protein